MLATVGIPTILMMLLFALPFIDRSAERRLSRRPVAIVAAILTAVAMGVLTWKGATTAEFLASEAPTLAKEFQEAEQPAAGGPRPAPSSSQPPAVSTVTRTRARAAPTSARPT